MLSPEIAVEQPLGLANDIATGGSRAFGSVNVGSNSDLVFTLNNTGGAALTLSGTPEKVALTGSADFSVNAQPASPVAASGSTTFTVRFAPTSPGAKTAVLSIANDDPDENPFIVNLTGTGLNGAPLASAATYTRAAGTSMKINIANLLASSTSDPDGDARTLVSVGASAQGASVSIASGRILYNPANSNNDSFSYTVSDGQGHTATSTINVMVVNPAGASVNFALNGLGQPTMQFAGIPGYRYTIQRTTNMSEWNDMQTFIAPANGVFSFTDATDPRPPTALYRMSYTPAP